MKPLLALLALLLLAAAPPMTAGPLRQCDGGGTCTPADLASLPLDAPETILVRTVTVDPGSLPLARPPMVWVIALASSEVRWNGVLVGRNGVPGPDRASERPGRFVATFVVPSSLVRPGANLLSVRLSAHHLWLPVRRPVHVIEVGPYESPDLPGLADYLPALLMLGALAAAFTYFLAAALSERRDPVPRLLAAIAGTGMVQLAAEVSRVFLAYAYPWHLVRVTGIALLAGATAVLIAAYAARRFAPAWRRTFVFATAAAAIASIIFFPWYDLKALGAILAGAAALAVAGAIGLGAGRPLARAAIWAPAVLVVLMVWQLTAFLDQAYYLWLAALLVALVAEQVSSLRRARAERDREVERAAALAERLAKAEREGEPILALKDGGRTHRVAESDIIYVRAADDYCDVVLRDGRALLVTMSLVRFLATLPDRFVRVHKSYAVNRAHVTSIAPRSGGGRALGLSEGSTVPVGRSYAAAVASWARSR